MSIPAIAFGSKNEPPKSPQNGYPKASEIPSWGHSPFGMLWYRDPAPAVQKIATLTATFTSLLALYYVDKWMPSLIPSLDLSWDEQHGIGPYDQPISLSLLPKVLSEATGLSIARISELFWLTVGCFGALVLADIALGSTVSAGRKKLDPKSKPNNNNNINDLANAYPWPASWKVDNYICYQDMFAEPARCGRVIRRPWNTISNATYLFASFIILASVSQNDNSIFWKSDYLFGVMMFILSIASILWHASNAPWTQYPDLWSMDSSILYLIIRFMCFGCLMLLKSRKTMSEESAKGMMGGLCLVIYSLAIAGLAHLQWGLFSKGLMHDTCPFSVRARLSGKSNVFGAGHKDIYIGTDLCVFAALPVFYLIPASIVLIFFATSVGSSMACKVTFRTLVLGWSYRITERWAMDCNPMMNWCNSHPSPTLLKRCVAAVVSPTGWLHATTGVTLLAGYAHALSVDSTA